MCDLCNNKKYDIINIKSDNTHCTICGHVVPIDTQAILLDVVFEHTRHAFVHKLSLVSPNPKCPVCGQVIVLAAFSCDNDPRGHEFFEDVKKLTQLQYQRNRIDAAVKDVEEEYDEEEEYLGEDDFDEDFENEDDEWMWHQEHYGEE